MLEAHDLSKTYGSGPARFDALQGVDLAIRSAESVAIVGKSGSGKSTLMHVLALLDSPSAGRVVVEGRDASTLSARDVGTLRNKRFGFVFQQFFLSPDLSVLDNVALPLAIAGVPVAEQRSRAADMLRAVGLEDKARNASTALSGGQKQRVAIARALVSRPAVVFADEPTGNLDSRSGALVEELLFDMQREYGITLVIVTHDDDLAARCERRIVVHDGRILYEVAA
ncbi:ABC transporter ATP-binding protein [Agromyces atrinae]|uniref:ABC transporter ATP-binding protein n=1 Tax=Agromyces atrinae TaxID=592376 RepID=UPI001F5632FE|nr:ABC transporter ATP-binding protein [Agromyces atrinae]MCI2957330.1 ABC transporter ATP-binding protein [Agromyces atrinae]